MHSNIDLKRYEFILFKQIPMIESAYHLKNSLIFAKGILGLSFKIIFSTSFPIN